MDFYNDDFFDYFYGDGNNFYGMGEPAKQGMSTESILLIALGCSILVAAVLLVTIFAKRNEGRFHGFMEKLYNFMNINRFITEDIIRYLNIVTVVALFGVGGTMCFTVGVVEGLSVIIFGNIAARIIYELILMFITLCRKSVSQDRRLKEIDRRLEAIEVYVSDDGTNWEEDEGCDGNCSGCSYDCGPEALIKPNIIYGEGPVLDPEEMSEFEVEEAKEDEIKEDEE